MKKVLALSLLLAMCLLLCACDTVSGEEAAALYPDIIGDWGADPFGEEFVLSLYGDGTCILLDQSGTWTLDTKASGDRQVILAVKTEQTAYRVTLERLGQGDPLFADLLIQDDKQKITVYDSAVFLPGTVYVTAEQALHAIPEIVGEWGSIFFYEETALTICEDGTCTLMRQPGRWCIVKSDSSWPKVRLAIKLDSGDQYTCQLMKYEYPEPEYRYDMFIYDTEGVHVYPNNYKNGVSDNHSALAINRTKYAPGEEWLPFVVGEWAENRKSRERVTFREDGTCSVFGNDGVWGIDWWNYEHMKANNMPGIYWYVVKINGEIYQISVDGFSQGKWKMNVHGDLGTYPDLVKLDR